MSGVCPMKQGERCGFCGGTWLCLRYVSKRAQPFAPPPATMPKQGAKPQQPPTKRPEIEP